MTDYWKMMVMENRLECAICGKDAGNFMADIRGNAVRFLCKSCYRRRDESDYEYVKYLIENHSTAEETLRDC